MNLIPEIEGNMLKLWRFWSVKFGVISGACSATVGVYEGFKAVDSSIVRHVPEQVIGILVAGAVLFTFASVISRGIDQPKLRCPPEADDNSEHA